MSIFPQNVKLLIEAHIINTFLKTFQVHQLGNFLLQPTGTHHNIKIQGTDSKAPSIRTVSQGWTTSPGFRHDKGMAQRWMGPLPDCLGSVGQEQKRRRREEGVGEGIKEFLTGRRNLGKAGDVSLNRMVLSFQHTEPVGSASPGV